MAHQAVPHITVYCRESCTEEECYDHTVLFVGSKRMLYYSSIFLLLLSRECLWEWGEKQKSLLFFIIPSCPDELCLMSDFRSAYRKYRKYRKYQRIAENMFRLI